jgi:cation:H+ antiporter
VFGEVLLVLLGVAALGFGADRAVEAGRRVAERLGVSDLVVGLTVTSIGTSLPELATTAAAAAQAGGAAGPAAGVAAGNILGSNLFLLGALLGATGLVKAFRVDVSELRRDGTVLALATVGVLLAASNGRIGRVEGGLLLLAFVAYLGRLAHGVVAASSRGVPVPPALVPAEAAPADGPAADGIATSPRRDAIELVVGLLAVIVGARVAVDHGIGIAEAVGVPGAVVGLWVGIGTSLPELTVSLQAARRGVSGIALGNVIGSAIANLLLCLGAACLATPLVVEATALDASFLVLITASSLLLLAENRELSRPEGAVLVLMFVVYLALRTAS